MRASSAQISSSANGNNRLVERNEHASGARSIPFRPGEANLGHQRELSRRIMNVMAALALLVISVPVMILIAIAVRLTSPGPILFVQRRIGMDRRNGSPPPPGCRRQVDLGGRPFRIYKFRTMYVQSGDRGAEVWAAPDDPRVTRVGRLLRKFRLDELPQLFNVLRGDMNLVGPRPEQPQILLQLREKIDGYQVRQRVRPGITGWAQVNQHYDQSIDDVRNKVALDLEYIGRRSVTEDLRIMARTIPVVLFRRGAW